MKTSLYILLIIFSIPVSGQTYKITVDDTTYLVNPEYYGYTNMWRGWFKDSIPDGKYLIYFSNDFKSLACKCTIKNGKKKEGVNIIIITDN